MTPASNAVVEALLDKPCTLSELAAETDLPTTDVLRAVLLARGAGYSILAVRDPALQHVGHHRSPDETDNLATTTFLIGGAA